MEYKINPNNPKLNNKSNNNIQLDTEAFNKYRNTYQEFGLGIKTGIDLPVDFLMATSHIETTL